MTDTKQMELRDIPDGGLFWSDGLWIKGPVYESTTCYRCTHLGTGKILYVSPGWEVKPPDVESVTNWINSKLSLTNREQSGILDEAISLLQNVPEPGQVWDENHATDNMRGLQTLRELQGKNDG